MDQEKEMKEQMQPQDLEAIELPPTPDDMSCSVLSAQDLDDINPEIIEAFQEAEQEQDKLNDNKPDPYAPSAPAQPPTQGEKEPEEEKPQEQDSPHKRLVMSSNAITLM